MMHFVVTNFAKSTAMHKYLNLHEITTGQQVRLEVRCRLTQFERKS